jgi:hypothetical protein
MLRPAAHLAQVQTGSLRRTDRLYIQVPWGLTFSKNSYLVKKFKLLRIYNVAFVAKFSVITVHFISKYYKYWQ